MLNKVSMVHHIGAIGIPSSAMREYLATGYFFNRYSMDPNPKKVPPWYSARVTR